MLRLPTMRLLLALMAALLPVAMVAQDDPNEAPLGDVARSMRRNTPPPGEVIDNDNLPKVMDEAESRHPWGSLVKVLTGGEGKSSTPNVTCSLSFNASPKNLLFSQYAQMELPPGEVQKLQGPATIEGNALRVSVFNGTDWHVSEVAIALTILRKTEPSDESMYDASAYSGPHSGSYGGIAKLATPAGGNPPQESDVRPEKKPDVTVIYRMRAAAPPSTTTVFSAPLNLELGPDQEWHWAMVQAKGYPPQNAMEMAQTTVQTSSPASIDPALVAPRLAPPLVAPQSAPAPSIPKP